MVQREVQVEGTHMRKEVLSVDERQRAEVLWSDVVVVAVACTLGGLYIYSVVIEVGNVHLDGRHCM